MTAGPPTSPRSDRDGAKRTFHCGRAWPQSDHMRSASRRGLSALSASVAAISALLRLIAPAGPRTTNGLALDGPQLNQTHIGAIQTRGRRRSHSELCELRQRRSLDTAAALPSAFRIDLLSHRRTFSVASPSLPASPPLSCVLSLTFICIQFTL